MTAIASSVAFDARIACAALVAALLLIQAAPDPVVLVGGEGEGQARFLDLAAGADGLGGGDIERVALSPLQAFYSATQDLGIANQVTTFTESEFGRTLQPSGSGCDE